MSRSSGKNDCRVYVGNLPPDIRTKDVEDIFYKYGKISNVDLKNRRGPPFAFVEFEDPRDAEDAVDKRDGYDYDGYKLRVEFPRGGRRDGGGGYGGGGRDRDGFRGGRGGFGGGRFDRGGGRGQTRRSQYRVLITGLPLSGSWQDLKDHMREAGDVCFADSYKDGTGVVEFLREEDMRYAIKKLNDTKFRSHEGDTTYIRVKEDRGKGRDKSRSRSRSRSRSAKRSSSRSKSRSPSPRSRSKSKSKSKSRSKSRERERSRSPVKSRSRSPSRSRSRSRSHSPND